MNLMVVLVPFLLMTAVFSQVSILNMNLPVGESESVPTEEEPPKALEVIIRANKLDVLDNKWNGHIQLVELLGYLNELYVDMMNHLSNNNIHSI